MNVILWKQYGRKLENGSWDGIVGDLVSGKFDVSFAPLIVTSEREQVPLRRSNSIIPYRLPKFSFRLLILCSHTSTRLECQSFWGKESHKWIRSNFHGWHSSTMCGSWWCVQSFSWASSSGSWKSSLPIPTTITSKFLISSFWLYKL